ncbi:MAG: TonB-dependent receptor [Dysgonamonadaceae bacterium]|nr:TonB-dependent receptor [Dysgonamonadaceae bacterium]
MRISLILLFVFAFQINAEHARSQSTKISLDMKNSSIEKVLQTIEEKSDYYFLYSNRLINVDRIVSLKVKNAAISSVLDRLFTSHDVEYEVKGSQIILSPKEISEITNDLLASKQQQGKTITGTIVDAQGEAIIGANIIEAGTTNGTVTDFDGNFRLNVSDDAVLRISYIGYLEQEVATEGRNTIDVVLREDTKTLEELIVIGYGSIKRKDITTAVSIVSTENLDNRPLMSAGQAIQGKAAGVQVVQPSGEPGGGLSIRVRGATSVQASNEPLYIVDGMPTDNISYMSPNDIESIQILKDASSAAIYGARAANGVVLITTKRGRIGEAKVKLSAYSGISTLGKKIDALNTDEYKILMKDLAKVSNTAPNIPDDEHRYVDWTDAFFKTGVNQNYQVSVASGSEKVQYYVAGGFTDEKGIVNKAKFNRYNFRSNIDSQHTSWLNMSLNFSYSKTKGQWVRSNSSSMRSGSILSVINTPPFMQEWNPNNPEHYDEMAYGSRILNPLAANAADNVTSTDYVKGSLAFTIDLYKGLKLKSTFGLDVYNEHWGYYMDPFTTAEGRNTRGKVEESFSKNREWLVENIFTYDASFDKHNLSLMGGATQQHAQYNSQYMAGFDLATSYPNIRSISAANQIDKDAASSSASAWALASFLGRVSYNYDSKYLLTANFRSDGSSKFAPGNRWGSFPSISAGWRISSEEFMKPLKEVVDDMKIRVGWGINGNQGGIGNYSYLGRMSRSRVEPTTENQYPGMAIYPNSAPNKELTWEKTMQWNGGLDFVLFNSRLNVSLDAYYKYTKDLLLTVSLPSYVNLPGGITRNDGEMMNKGIEMMISSQNLKGEFKWDTDFNISFNRNELTKLGLNKVYYYGGTYETGESAVVLREGLSLGTFYGYISEGVDPETGDLIYSDLNDNGITDPGDRTEIGCAQPDFTYGMTNNFSYKGFGLSIFLQGSQGNDIFNASKIDMESMIDFRNQSKQVLYRWQRPGMITDIPRVGNIENIHNSTRFVEDGSYLRVKNVTFSYNLNSNWLKKTHLSNLQVYVTGQNLLTFTNYKGYDPEVNAYGGNSVVQGVDYGTYPQSKAVIFGFNVEF